MLVLAVLLDVDVGGGGEEAVDSSLGKSSTVNVDELDASPNKAKDGYALGSSCE
jgi:hypothetical protein